MAPLPVGYEGEFGPGIKTMIITLYYGGNMSEPKIIELLSHWGISISDGQVSNLLTKGHEPWHEEKAEIYRAGLGSGSWQHIDDTGTRVNGENQYCHIVSNPYYTAYFTRPRKDRLTVIGLLQNAFEPQFLLNDKTRGWLELLSVPGWACAVVNGWPQGRMSYERISAGVEAELSKLNDQQRARVLEAAALTAYHTQTAMPVPPILMSDDANQFKLIALLQALCWIHDGRHYKKMTPCVEHHRKLLDDFRREYWAFYTKMEQYRADADEVKAEQLRLEFDALFNRKTGYDELDKRIAKTKAKKEQLLIALEHPELPLHNNPAELGARQRVRKRDVSFGPRTKAGMEAWDTFMTVAETAKKLGVSFYAYIHDPISKRNALPKLAELINRQSLAFHPVHVPTPP